MIRKRILIALLMVGAIFSSLALVSLLAFSHESADNFDEMAQVEAKAFWDAIIAMRFWNASHGGVYAAVSELLEPNPYLKDAQRDIMTTDGKQLTQVNPAYMTRLVAKNILEESGILVRITSLKPIRPQNMATAWERAALEEYERTGRPAWAKAGEGEAAVYRYLEGLRIEKPCLQCHAEQGYKVGDLRGGISVTIPARPYARAAALAFTHLALIHAIFWICGLGFLWILGRRLLRGVAEVEASQKAIKRLEGLLPICSYCRKIRQEGGDPKDPRDWLPLERYISDHSEADFTHSICPECMHKVLPGGEDPGEPQGDGT